jgi:hypothetical protein
MAAPAANKYRLHLGIQQKTAFRPAGRNAGEIDFEDYTDW